MPVVQPGQSDQKTPAPYGAANNDNAMTLHERLLKRFQPQEFVTVQNIDDEALTWQYLPEGSESFEYTPDPMKITRRGDPEVWILDAGKTDTLVGANAYVMIDALYKKLVAKKVLATVPEVQYQGRNFNYADGGQQEKLIDMILIGKATPTFNTPSSAAQDLELDDTASKAAKSIVGVGTSAKA